MFNTKQFFFITPIRPEYLLVFKEIKSLLTEKEDECKQKKNLCQLKDFCDHSCKDAGKEPFTDYNCHASPWLRADEEVYKDSCPFAVT